MCQSRQGEVMQQECNLIYTSEFFLGMHSSAGTGVYLELDKVFGVFFFYLQMQLQPCCPCLSNEINPKIVKFVLKTWPNM